MENVYPMWQLPLSMVAGALGLSGVSVPELVEGECQRKSVNVIIRFRRTVDFSALVREKGLRVTRHILLVCMYELSDIIIKNYRYKICNFQSCPPNEVSFRAKQCSKYDNVCYQGGTYKWLPYFDNSK